MPLNIMSFGIAAIFISQTLQGRRHFVKYVNPIFIKGADYTHHTTTRNTPPLRIFRPSFGPALWYKSHMIAQAIESAEELLEALQFMIASYYGHGRVWQ